LCFWPRLTAPRSEKDHNPLTYEEAAAADNLTAYGASKALAEKAMWRWMEDNKPGFTSVALCPAWVLGPHASALASVKSLNESTQILYKLLDAPDVPPPDFPAAIDVRDLATVHLAALERSAAAGQRFPLGQRFDYQLAVDIVRREMPELCSRIPAGNVGYEEPVWQVDSSKAVEVLGLKYAPMETTMRDAFQELVKAERA
jgi:NADPH-dependent methylglyoxal reductase